MGARFIGFAEVAGASGEEEDEAAPSLDHCGEGKIRGNYHSKAASKAL